ncbi:MAG: DNA primase [Chloroflexota bacterium]
MTAIDEVKARIDIVDLVSEAGVKLRRAGRNYTGFCPFHSNTKTPAFVVWPETGTWRCFGQCNEGGDVFKFVMKKEGWDFAETLRHLAGRAGVELEPLSPQRQEQAEEYDRLRTLLEEAVIFYRGHLLNQADVLAYLHDQRGLTDATIETFGLGYAPNGWDAALRHFTGRGYTEQELFDAGMLSERDSGGYYDRFRNRIMIPIRDERGRMAGFGARVVDPDDIPKFLNSPQTPLFDKGRLLYGLDRARKPIRAADQAVIVEGYFDAIALHQAGYENAVSPMGTALTEDQLRLLKRFTRRIVLALDPDAAGQKAVLRGLEAARSAMDREAETRFDARGLLRHESRLQADLRVAAIPDELDPDEIVARDPSEWARILEKAKPIVTHVMETLVAEQDITQPKVKSQIAAQVVPLIEDLPNPVERDTYRQQLARLLRVDERSLMAAPGQSPRVGRGRGRQARVQEQPVESAPVAAALNPSQKLEAACLGILLNKPELLCRLDRVLQEGGLNALSFEDFGYTDHQLLLGLIRRSAEQDVADPHRFVLDNLPDDLQALYADLTQAAAGPNLRDDRLLEELFRVVKSLRKMASNESLNQLRFLQENAQQQDDADTLRDYQKQAAQHMRLLRDLDQASKSLAARRIE